MENSPLHWSDEKVLQELKALRIGYGVKKTMRYSTVRDFTVHSESVAEHLFALHYLALYFLPFEDPEGKLDKNKIHTIITFHDFGEIIHGDVPYHLKTDEHRKQEAEDAKVVFASLPESIRQMASDSWNDYEQQISPEAKFVCALDKMEPLFELFDPINELSLKRLKHTYKSHFEKKAKATDKFPVMKRFLDVGTKDMAERKVFWDNSPA
jgi:5'-deoxynucleotidase YfbR-like HD superfamily hydrolase